MCQGSVHAQSHWLHLAIPPGPGDFVWPIFFGNRLLALAYWWLSPNPQKHVALATGQAQSAYEESGKRYAKALELDGITVELIATQGSSANLQLLREGKADLGFVQGGTSDYTDIDKESLQSLGSLFLNPCGCFYREEAARKITVNATLTGLTQLQGMNINTGTPGSGVPGMPPSFDSCSKVRR